VMVILGNFFVTAPSSSILTPSGDLFKSTALLEKRMVRFRTLAKEIAGIKEHKIAVLGYFHNPNVIFQILRSAPSYKAVKIGREDYRILTDDKEYVFIYFVIVKPEDMEKGIDFVLKTYHLKNYVFVSATYDLTSLQDRGLKTQSFGVIKRKGL
jgi:hypothetical protein